MSAGASEAEKRSDDPLGKLDRAVVGALGEGQAGDFQDECAAKRTDAWWNVDLPVAASVGLEPVVLPDCESCTEFRRRFTSVFTWRPRNDDIKGRFHDTPPVSIAFPIFAKIGAYSGSACTPLLKQYFSIFRSKKEGIYFGSPQTIDYFRALEFQGAFFFDLDCSTYRVLGFLYLTTTIL